MTLYEAVQKIVMERMYGDYAESVPLFYVDDHVDRMTHSEFVKLLSTALEKVTDASQTQ